MAAKKLIGVISSADSLYDVGTGKRKKVIVKKTSLQKEKEEKSERRSELTDQLKRALAEEKELVGEGTLLKSEDISGMKVVHRKFGEGEVVSSGGKFFTVRFRTREVKMQFPGAFDKGILAIPDDAAQASLIEDICSQYRALEAKAAEAEQRVKELGLQIVALGN